MGNKQPTPVYNNVVICKKICHFVAKVSDLTYIHETYSDYSEEVNVEIGGMLKAILEQVCVLENVVVKNMCVQGKTHEKHIMNYIPEGDEARNTKSVYMKALSEADSFLKDICSKIK